MTLQHDATEALLTLSDYPHVPAALMARFAGRRVSQLTEEECRALLRSIEWLKARLAKYHEEFR